MRIIPRWTIYAVVGSVVAIFLFAEPSLGLLPFVLATVTGKAGGNHLVAEKSPYLQQHAYNPVNWYPWSDEAFAKAIEKDKPIFLSIGYSTCHWCHVMEEESFENEEVAAYLNEHFISIKVDREERPDIDHIYMTAVHAMGQRGGWPLTIIMTPDKKPFFGGTYFPPYGRGGATGLMDILSNIGRAWQNDRPNLENIAGQLMDATKANAVHVASGDATLNETVSQNAYRMFESRFDEKWGGFGEAPKFPSPPNLAFLLRYWYRTKDQKALEMVEKTATLMSRGGLYDHLAGGFHRYSVDRYWRVSHFEKMLYDNAQLSSIYLELFQITGDKTYEAVARGTLDYILREMTSPEGGFYTATDADSEGEEGTFFVWRPEEITELLGEDAGAIFNRYYHVDAGGSFEHGTSVLFVSESVDSFAEAIGMPSDTVHTLLTEWREILYQARLDREPPLRDEKILASWNALMISAFVQGYLTLGDTRYRDAALSAATMIREQMWKDGTLYRRVMGGELSSPGFLEDYTFVVSAALDLYEMTFDLSWYTWALELSETLEERFWDQDKGGYFFTSINQDDIPVRAKEAYDGVMPSGNAMAAEVNLRLAEFSSDTRWRQKADSVFAAFGDQIAAQPGAFTHMLSGLESVFHGTFEIVFSAGDDDAGYDNEGLSGLHAGLGRVFVPHKVVALAGDSEAEKLMPMLKNRPTQNGKATVYVCQNYTCQLPVNSVDAMYGQLGVERGKGD